MFRQRLFAVLILLGVPLFLHAQLTIEDQLYAYVLGLEGKSRPERAAFIKAQIDQMGVGSVSAPYRKVVTKRGDTTLIEGENLIVRMGRGQKRLIVGAHYDAAPNSPGANDNASGTAVLLGLIDRLQGMGWNYAIDFVFFDQEETGMWGSTLYVQQFLIPSRTFAMINVDVVGNGEEVYAGPTVSSNYNLAAFLKAGAKTANVPLVMKAEYPPSDYLTFTSMKIENISVSVVPKGEGDKISASIRATGKADSAASPRIIGIMNSPDDRAILLKPESLKMAYDFLRATLEAINDRM